MAIPKKEDGIIRVFSKENGNDDGRQYCRKCGCNVDGKGKIMIAHWEKNGLSGYTYRCAKCNQVIDFVFNKEDDPIGGWD